MAFDATKMNRLNIGPTQLYAYESADAIATVAASGYFDSFADELKKGSLIIAYDNNVDTVDLLVVTSASGVTPVTTVNGT